jgi:hypothetical protein
MLMLLSLTTSSYAATTEQETSSSNTRDLTMTQAQKFAAMKPRLTTMEEVKAKNQQSNVLEGFNNKLSLALGEALDFKSSSSGSGGNIITNSRKEEPRTVITVDKSKIKPKNTGIVQKTYAQEIANSLRKKDQVKNDGDNNKETEKTNLFNLNQALGQALNNDKGSSGKFDAKGISKEKSGMEARISSLPQGL